MRNLKMNIFRRLTRPMTRQSGWELAIIFGFSALLVLGLLLARANVAGAASGATITSDKEDYAPGATVTLTGAGWASGEAVHIFVNDSVGNTWSLNSNPDPAADTNGSFTYSFSLPNSFIANYTATATGPTSGTATTTFTDSNSNCPSTDPTKWLTDNQVGASHTTSGNTATYTFSSFVNEHPVSGSPGLIYYCVYTTPLPASITPQAVGVGGALWQTGTATTPDRFSFERPNGNNNIPLDGTNTTMGTATWSSSVQQVRRSFSTSMTPQNARHYMAAGVRVPVSSCQAPHSSRPRTSPSARPRRPRSPARSPGASRRVLTRAR